MSHVGITVRKTRAGTRYRAEAYDKAMGKRVTKTFPTLAAAKSWRAAMQVKIANGEARATGPLPLKQAGEDWMKRAKAGTVRNRSGAEYKPSVLRGYEQKLRLHIYPKLGHLQVGDVRVSHVQALVDQLVDKGASASAVRNTVNPLRCIYKDLIRRELVSHDPCVAVALPSGGETRDRIASVPEAIKLLDALEEDQRPLWATAFLAGLRRGELMALRWEDIDWEIKTITVSRSYDPPTRSFVTPKSRKGARVVPFPDLLTQYLATDLTMDSAAVPLCFGRPNGQPFGNYATVRAHERWKACGLEPINLHECRHTYASLMIAAGVNIGTVSDYMGHASVAITLDRYRHLMPGNEQEAMKMLNTYIADQQRLAAEKAQIRRSGDA